MSLIIVQHDPSIILPEIVQPLTITNTDETGVENTGNTTGTLQTRITGIIHPLLSLNGFTVDFEDIESFELSGTNALPSCSFSFRDKKHVFSQLSNPGPNNQLQVQIIPPYDGAYKKINLLFYCTKLDITGNLVSGTGQYGASDFQQAQYKAYGLTSTWELCNTISSELQLGFASNCENTDDSRYVYCNYKSYSDLISDEMSISESTETRIMDWWIDFWNYLVLCDIYERYNTEDTEEDMRIYINSNPPDTSIDASTPEPLETDAVLIHHPSFAKTELYVEEYTMINNTYLGWYQGTTKMESIYSYDSKDYVDNFIMNGDVDESAETVVYEYGGEYYGDYNYKLAETAHEFYLNKMNMEQVQVTLNMPQLGITRGSQVRLVWYDNDTSNTMWRNAFEGEDGNGLTPISNLDLGWLSDYVTATGSGTDDVIPLSVNLQVSGQYTVTGIVITFENYQWSETLTLVRPASRKIQILPNEEET